MLHEHYPSSADVDAWCEALLARADDLPLSIKELKDAAYPFQLGVRHIPVANAFLAFECVEFERFYGYWQPAPYGGPAPLLVHLPGYGAEMSAHPELAAAGFNVLHVNPLGYATPTGPNEDKRRDGAWPVLPDTVTSCGERGYVDWLTNALMAVRWAVAQPCVQPDRLGCFGTSQGGGTALLLASILQGRGVKAAAADVPFLTNFPHMANKSNPGAYHLAFAALEALKAETPERETAAWRAIGFIDTMSHAHRLTMPTLLTAGQEDQATPADSIEPLFATLPGTRSYTEMAQQGHTYTVPFLRLAAAWFTLYL